MEPWDADTTAWSTTKLLWQMDKPESELQDMNIWSIIAILFKYLYLNIESNT
jgi:hypothetical protein